MERMWLALAFMALAGTVDAQTLHRSTQAAGGALADADAGVVVQHDVAVLDHRLVLDRQVVPALVIDPVPFEHQKIGDGCANMGGGHRAEGAGNIVRGQGDVKNLGHIGDLAAF